MRDLSGINDVLSENQPTHNLQVFDKLRNAAPVMSAMHQRTDRHDHHLRNTRKAVISGPPLVCFARLLQLQRYRSDMMADDFSILSDLEARLQRETHNMKLLGSVRDAVGRLAKALKLFASFARSDAAQAVSQRIYSATPAAAAFMVSTFSQIFCESLSADKDGLPQLAVPRDRQFFSALDDTLREQADAMSIPKGMARQALPAFEGFDARVSQRD